MELVLLMLAVMAVCILLGVPIGVSLMAASASVLMIEPHLNIFMLARRFYSSLDSFILLAVPLFLLAGSLMNETGITERLIRLSYALVGHLRGGLAHINILVSMLFAGVSGSSTADTAGVGAVMIPAMQKKGYSTSVAVAVTAASSVLGGIIPPSIFFVVWGAITGTSVAQLFAGGIIPGILIALAQMGYVARRARAEEWPVEKRANRTELREAFTGAVLGLGTPVIIIGGIITGFATPTEASILAVLYAFFLGLVVYRTLNFERSVEVLSNSAKLVSLSLFCYGSAGLFGWLLAFYKVPNLLLDATGGMPAYLLLPAFALLCIVLGTFLDALVIAIIVGPLFLPAMLAVGVDPVHYGVIAGVSLAVGLITPPYGLCLLIACAIGKIPMHDALRDTMKMFGVILLVLALLIVVPPITTLLPGLVAG
ncbi:TRAP transporter large permease [Sulfitobacter sp. D35]|uniref:TRAP transporter large permease n=1 Tax=Sulfitobacter sp. D35 TaxID=3083252 RepID=UPI00296E6261|nr:TRAP transporter large permease [Sulfitobacter sp. D35]MDW4499943.1 TRAP transporter large permease [Sulfitobacter sp. D35]